MILYKIEELRNSRIFFDKQPPKFFVTFVGFLFFFLLFLFYISMSVQRPYIVHAGGSIITLDNTYVSVKSDGSVLHVEKEEGAYVEKGDVLFYLANGIEEAQVQSVSNQINGLKEKEIAINKFEQSLSESTNFLGKEGYELEYHGKMEYYLLILKEEEMRNKQRQSDKIKKETLILKVKEEITMLKSEKVGTNPEEMAEFDLSIVDKENQLEAEEENLNILLRQENEGSQVLNTKLQMLSELGGERNKNALAKEELEGQFNVFQIQDKLTQITAESNGYVHYLNSIKVGVSVQRGQVYAEVSENKKSDMKIEAFIQASDITKVDVGNLVSIEMLGVNIQKFGTLSGAVERIDQGVIVQESAQGNQILYRCVIRLNETSLQAKDGTLVKGIKSMPVSARIVYDRETYLEWMLGLLNLV